MRVMKWAATIRTMSVRLSPAAWSAQRACTGPTKASRRSNTGSITGFSDAACSHRTCCKRAPVSILMAMGARIVQYIPCPLCARRTGPAAARFPCRSGASDDDASPPRAGGWGLPRQNAADAPKFQASALGREEDMDTLRRGVRLAREICEQPGLREILGEEVWPGPDISSVVGSNRLDDAIRKQARTIFSPRGHVPHGARLRPAWLILNCASMASKACASPIALLCPRSFQAIPTPRR